MERLSRYISRCGVASRRKAEVLIRQGIVSVNAISILEPQFKVDSETDSVTVNGVPLTPVLKNRYIALYKPVGYISDLKDGRNRPLARDLINLKGILYPVGRLDYNSEGLMVFTDDGEFANRLMHPRYGVEKEYQVKLKGALEERDRQNLKIGFSIEGVLHKVKEITLMRSTFRNNWYRIVVSEGRNRMLRKLGARIDHGVLKLKRVRMGSINLESLKPGEFRHLSEREIKEIIEGITAKPEGNDS
jgi:23S rRNA pseudouridine2605 synthase